MKIFITGATGFIGRRLVDRLLSGGHEVVALVRNKEHGLPKGIEIAYGDVLTPDSFKESGQRCDRLYHLAALITFVPEHKAELLRVNGQGTINVLAAAGRWNVPCSVVVSSACTIGLSHSKKDILDENSILREGLAENNPYLASKILAERAALEYTDSQKVVIVNPTTVYGPGDKTLNSGTLILKIARAAILPVPPGGSNVVDVDDVVDGIIAAGERGKSGKRYILGYHNLSFSEIFSTITEVVENRPILIAIPKVLRKPAELMAEITGKLGHNRFLTAQIVGDLFAFKYYSSKRANQDLNWQPKYSFRESIERAWDFYLREGLV